MENPSGNRMLDDLERAYKLRQDVDRCEDLESEEKAMVNLTSHNRLVFLRFCPGVLVCIAPVQMQGSISCLNSAAASKSGHSFGSLLPLQ